MELDLFKVLFISLGVMVAGLASLFSVRKLDRKNYIIQKVTPLPLALVSERDDVWLKGKAECDSPLSGPHFGSVCLYYDYKIEENVNRGRGKKPEWKILEESSEAAAFFLRDGEHTIHIDGNDAEFKDLKEDSGYEGPRRHTLNYFPYPADVNVVGSVSEGKKSLESRANIPLLVTIKNREDYVQEAERKEAWVRRFGFFGSWAGMTVSILVGMSLLPWVTPDTGRVTVETLRLIAVAPTIFFGFYWFAFKYNTLVNYRNRIDNAWHQVDVDLSMRYELIPTLVECAKDFMKHERALLDSLTSLRSHALTSREKKLASEGEVATLVGQTVARIEKYPDLKAQGSVFQVTRQMRAIEEKIAHGRSIYNEAVREYNDNVRMFPQVLIARLFGFAEHAFFSTPREKKASPEIVDAQNRAQAR
jgi:LemA protein